MAVSSLTRVGPTEFTATAALIVLLGLAVRHTGRWWDGVLAVGCAAAAIAVGAVGPRQAWRQLADLAPVLGFLVAVLVLASMCQAEGLFTALGHRLARRPTDRRLGSPSMLGAAFAVAAGTTAVLGLDATAVLLTPVVLGAAVARRVPPRPYAYACVRLSNSGSLLLPVSNLTNLVVFAASRLSFGGFAWRLLPVWLAVLALEYGGLRWWFRDALRAQPDGAAPAIEPLPRTPLLVLVLVLVGFLLAPLAGLGPAWVAGAGALVLVVRALAHRAATPRDVLAAANLSFGLWVLCLGVVVAGVTGSGAGRWLADVLAAIGPGPGLVSMLAVAGLAAVCAAVLNNLPATLLLVPLVAASGAPGLLAMLVGVNLGSNLTLTGSLANLLWRRTVARTGLRVRVAHLHWYGLATCPVVLPVAVVVLWAWLRLLG